MKFEEFKLDESGLVPVIIQDERTSEILMLGYMNQEAYEKTLETNKVHFFSRSRKKLWLKGETSSNFLNVVSITSDCDNDTLLVKANPDGPTCHTGEKSCFFNNIKEADVDKSSYILFKLYDLISDRIVNEKEGSYTNYLLRKGIDKISNKIAEESIQTVIACKNGDKRDIIFETTDLMYHLLVMLNDMDIPLEEIFMELNNRYRG